jgi:hypothetical protein
MPNVEAKLSSTGVFPFPFIWIAATQGALLLLSHGDTPDYRKQPVCFGQVSTGQILSMVGAAALD